MNFARIPIYRLLRRAWLLPFSNLFILVSNMSLFMFTIVLLCLPIFVESAGKLLLIQPSSSSNM
jgi:hypothetical protein